MIYPIIERNDLYLHAPLLLRVGDPVASSLLPAVHSSLRVSSLSLPVQTSAEEEELEP